VERRASRKTLTAQSGTACRPERRVGARLSRVPDAFTAPHLRAWRSPQTVQAVTIGGAPPGSGFPVQLRAELLAAYLPLN